MTLLGTPRRSCRPPSCSRACPAGTDQPLAGERAGGAMTQLLEGLQTGAHAPSAGLAESVVADRLEEVRAG